MPAVLSAALPSSVVIGSTTSNIAVVAVVIIALGWVVYGIFNVVADRQEVGSEIELPANRQEEYADETPAGARLERVQLDPVMEDADRGEVAGERPLLGGPDPSGAEHGEPRDRFQQVA